MGSVTFAVDEGLKPRFERFSWVNWSETARQEIVKADERADLAGELLKIVSKSKFTEKDADALSEKVKAAMHKRLEGK